jgi:dTDP-4-dehydrorhamnose 3,5-epimerase
VLSAWAEVEYKCTDFYDGADEIAIAWNDPAIAIPWPVEKALLSEKDLRAPRLAEIDHELPRYEEFEG